jgi:hypothetical protein
LNISFLKVIKNLKLTTEGLAFLGRMLNPPPQGPEVENLRRMIAQWKEMWKNQKGVDIN